MKKSVMICSVLSAIMLSSSIVLPTFAASNPADNASRYSYNTGRQAYESRMAENHPWYDNEEDAVTSDYSFNLGTSAAKSRSEAFAEMPSGDGLTDEELNAFFESHGIGTGSAYSDGQYDESAKSSYGYAKGQSENKDRSTSFTGNN